MLEKPNLQDDKIITCLLDEYGLNVAQITFLPLGADQHTAVYRVVVHGETSYFLKLRRGVFDETSVTLPKFLSDQGLAQIIAPLTSKTGQLWVNLDTFKGILYSFVEGRNGYEVNLSEHHWREFGTALKKIHSTIVPPALIKQIRRETYSDQWRKSVKTFLELIENSTFDDPLAIKLAAFLKAKRTQTLGLVERTEQLAQALQAQSPEFILCHSDIHAGNILIDETGGFYLVDWDDPILAPKERDLMFVGGGVGGVWYKAHEEKLFYEGYGQTEINAMALAYYRYERIIEDMAIYCEQILLSQESEEDRAQSLQYLLANFLPNNTIASAYQSDKALG